ncbi:MAG TPA: thioredoxin family protein [Fimbriimonadaceae bacterium]|jgi:thiol-disulfide isomerase/thioredoxin
MKYKYILLAALGTVLPCASVSFAQTQQSVKPLKPETDMSHDGWYAEYNAAKAKALATGEDMLIDFGGSDWCAPCRQLKEKVFTQKAFNALAQKEFICVDIDDLRRGLSPERKARYRALQKQFQVGSFPSVILTTPEGQAYGWATYSDSTNTPETFWTGIQPLIERGKLFRDALAKASTLTGQAKAEAMVSGMKEIRADLLWRFHASKIAELRKLDPSDSSKFLAYLDAREGVDEMENNLAQDYKLNTKMTTADVDNLIAKYHLQGEMLQQAFIMKAVIETSINRDPYSALECFGKVVEEEGHLSPYDQHGYLPMTPDALDTIQKSVALGIADKSDKVAQFHALHRIFEFELPDRYQTSCHGDGLTTFRPGVVTRESIAGGFANAVLEQTSNLSEEERKAAVQKALVGTRFLSVPSFKKVTEIVPDYFENAYHNFSEGYTLK